MGDLPEQRLSEIEQLRVLNPALADEAIELGRKLTQYGVRYKIAVPDDGDSVPGWNAPAPEVPRVSAMAVLAAQPASGEVSKEQAASWARAGLTAISTAVGMLGALGWLGWIKPEHINVLNNPALAGMVSVIIFAAARVWSWHQARSKAKQKAREIATALQLPATRANEAPVTTDEVRRVTRQTVAVAKAQLRQQ